MQSTKTKIIGKLTEIFADLFLVALAFALAFYLRIGGFQSTDFYFEPYFNLALLISPFFIFLFIWGGLYSFQEKNFWNYFRIISLSSLSGSMAFVLIFFFNREIFFSRLIIAYIFTFSTILVFAFHYLLSLYKRNLYSRGKWVKNTLIIGANRTAEEIIQRLQNGSEYFPVAILAPYGAHKKEFFGVPVLGKLNALEDIVKDKNIHCIMQCDAVEQSLNLIAFAEGRFLDFKMSPEILGIFSKNVQPENISDLSFLSLNLSPLFGWGQFFKRLFDIIISIPAVFFLGILYVVTFGKIFTKEKRARGLEDEFLMCRFKIKNIVLRDLPAFWNVFKGEMSVVGPRPVNTKERDDFPLHFHRKLIFKPGITGLWQIAKVEGAEETSIKAMEKDMEYIHYWSFRGDMKIFFKSIYLLCKGLF